MNKKDTYDELKDAPVLHGAQGKDPFIVPEGYFEQLPQRVQARLGGAASRPRWSIVWRPAVAAASLAVILALLILRDNTPRGGEHPDALAIEVTGAMGVDELLDLVHPDDLYAELATQQAAWLQPGTGFTPEELAAYLDQAELPLDLLTEMP